MAKMRNCLNCDKLFKGRASRKFCSRSCAASYNNKKREISHDTRRRISRSLREYYATHPMSGLTKSKQKESHTKLGHRRNSVSSIYDVSSRTRTKVLRRLGLARCSKCGWSLGTPDIHHISGKSREHTNLVVLCPNHHRLAHEGKLDVTTLPTLADVLPENWKDYYYG